jgi:hypothetical protein
MEKRATSADGVVMRLTQSSFTALLACLLAACASTDTIEMSGDPAALPPFKSFRITEEQFVFATEITPEQREKVSKELRAAAVSALEKRGYQEAANPDVLVALAAMSRPTLSPEAESASGLHHVDTSVLDAGRTFTPPQAETPPSGVGREGDLMLYLTDAKTRKPLWHASSNGAATTPGEALRKARATYAAMVAKLPKAGGGTSHE